MHVCVCVCVMCGVCMYMCACVHVCVYTIEAASYKILHGMYIGYEKGNNFVQNN